MNATTLTEAKTKQSIWFGRHGKLFYNIAVCLWMLLGALPGFGMFVVFYIMHQRHVQLSLMQNVYFLMASVVVISFGLCIGTIAGCLTFIAERFCLPEESNIQQK